MVIQHLWLVLTLVLLTVVAFDVGVQFCKQPRNETALCKDSSEMVQLRRPQERSYLNIGIDLKKDGSFEVVKATRVSGEVILQDFQTSDFIYEVVSGNTTLAVAFFPEDPFEVRAFGDPKDQKEIISQGQSATMIVNIPLLDGSLQEIRKLRLRIFKLAPGTNVVNIDASVLTELKAQKKLVLINDLPAKAFGQSISKKLIRMRD